jgi:hypothetical protein
MKKKIDKLIQDALEGSISNYRDYDYDVIKETIIICRSKMKDSSSSRHCQRSSNEESSQQIQQSSKESSNQIQLSSKKQCSQKQSNQEESSKEESNQECSSQSSLHYQYNHWSVVYKACCRLMARYVIDMSADKIIEEFNLLN